MRSRPQRSSQHRETSVHTNLLSVGARRNMLRDRYRPAESFKRKLEFVRIFIQSPHPPRCCTPRTCQFGGRAGSARWRLECFLSIILKATPVIISHGERGKNGAYRFRGTVSRRTILTGARGSGLVGAAGRKPVFSTRKSQNKQNHSPCTRIRAVCAIEEWPARPLWAGL